MPEPVLQLALLSGSLGSGFEQDLGREQIIESAVRKRETRIRDKEEGSDVWQDEP